MKRLAITVALIGEKQERHYVRTLGTAKLKTGRRTSRREATLPNFSEQGKAETIDLLISREGGGLGQGHRRVKRERSENPGLSVATRTKNCVYILEQIGAMCGNVGAMYSSIFSTPLRKLKKKKE